MSSKRTPLTIVFCGNSAFGIVNFRGGVIRALLQQGHRVIVVAPDDAVHAPVLRRVGAGFVPWAVTGQGTGLRAELAAVRRLARIYRELRPDLAFHFTIKAVIYGAIAARLNHVPFVSVITGLGYVFLNETWTSKMARVLYSRTLRWAREVWFLNEDDRRTFERLRLISETPLAMLPGEGIDMNHFAYAPLPAAARPAGHVTFLMVARLLRDKGVVEFVAASRRVSKTCPGTRFQLLGPADAQNPSAISRADIDEWVADGSVEYLGETSDVRPAIAAADCVVLPSYREGTPRCLLEAASMGRALVASDVPGCREVVIANESGLLCRARDADDLAVSLETIARLKIDRLAEMGRCGRKLMAARFDEGIVIRQYFDAIGRLASPRREPDEG